MSKKVSAAVTKKDARSKNKVTSIGASRNTRPNNKHHKRNHKRYRGQGR